MIGAGEDLLQEFRCQLSLFEDGFEDGVAACGEIVSGSEGIFDVSQLAFIEATGGFFAVACDEGDGVSVFEQSGGAVNATGADVEGSSGVLAEGLQVEGGLRRASGVWLNCSVGRLRHGGK